MTGLLITISQNFKQSFALTHEKLLVVTPQRSAPDCYKGALGGRFIRGKVLKKGEMCRFLCILFGQHVVP